ncbi:MAG: CDP-glucose 4,6-dehydratase [Planctomycetota bacterium]|jgi:CDP-glucose 4,6-dehydratase
MVTKIPLQSFYRGKTVLVTGHTGFKGGWLTTWLKLLGANVIGYALPPEKDEPNLFGAGRVAENMTSVIDDIRELPSLAEVFTSYKPEIVFHLAAQSLVRRAYSMPVETYDTNIMGTVNVLEAARRSPSVKVVVVVTSDKCYENREWVYAYRENDPMGGHDPYSASKGAAELVTSSYRNSFFAPAECGDRQLSLSSVRAGNVIGGGDWAQDRLIPDCIRALTKRVPIAVRNPNAVRPWQYVLEPLSGYLWLVARMWEEPARFAGAWNFGPTTDGNAPVHWVVDTVVKEWGHGEWQDISTDMRTARHEANLLRLDCTKAATLLKWKPVYSLLDSLRETVAWYRHHHLDNEFDAFEYMKQQIESYVKAAFQARICWAVGDGQGSGQT